MKKLIKPAVPGAVIPDIERGPRPAGRGPGARLDPHWALMERRGDIVAEDPPAEPAPAATADPEDPVAEAAASGARLRR